MIASAFVLVQEPVASDLGFERTRLGLCGAKLRFTSSASPSHTRDHAYDALEGFRSLGFRV